MTYVTRRFCQRGEPESGADRGGAGADVRQEGSKAVESSGGSSSGGGARSIKGRGGSGGDAEDQGRVNLSAVERSPNLESGGVEGEGGGSSGGLVTVLNPDHTSNVIGADQELGLSGITTSREITGNSSGSRVNTIRCAKKRSISEVSSSSKRVRSEVWVLAGRSEATTGDKEIEVHMEQESGEVLNNVSNGKKKKSELGRSSGTETPRSTTTGPASSSARRRLEVSTPSTNQQRSQTFHQASPSSSHQGSAGGVTMQVEMLTEKGVENITYRVKLTTLMQKVIDKV